MLGMSKKEIDDLKLEKNESIALFIKEWWMKLNFKSFIGIGEWMGYGTMENKNGTEKENYMTAGGKFLKSSDKAIQVETPYSKIWIPNSVILEIEI